MILQEQTTSIIPSVVFSGVLSAIIGALIALLSIYLQNKASDKRQTQLLEEQTNQHNERLEHESTQKRLDREMNLRRDIYLSGAESIGKMQRYLLSFADVNIKNEAQNEITEGVIESINKVALIASIEIFEELAKLHKHYLECCTLLVEKKKK